MFRIYYRYGLQIESFDPGVNLHLDFLEISLISALYTQTNKRDIIGHAIKSWERDQHENIANGA